MVCVVFKVLVFKLMYFCNVFVLLLDNCVMRVFWVFRVSAAVVLKSSTFILSIWLTINCLYGMFLL